MKISALKVCFTVFLLHDLQNTNQNLNNTERILQTEVSEMAKRAMKEKEIIDHLQQEGFKELKESEKNLKWYKKASERPTCLKAIAREKAKR
jgi:hypothetical protein